MPPLDILIFSYKFFAQKSSTFLLAPAIRLRLIFSEILNLLFFSYTRKHFVLPSASSECNYLWEKPNPQIKKTRFSEVSAVLVG